MQTFFSALFLLLMTRSQCTNTSTVGHLLPNNVLSGRPTDKVNSHGNSTLGKAEGRALRYHETFYICIRFRLLERKRIVFYCPVKLSHCVKRVFRKKSHRVTGNIIPFHDICRPKFRSRVSQC